MSHINKLLGFLSFSSVLLLAPTQTLFAQELAEARAIEEVVVTARGREENLQSVPESITAFSAEQIERAGIKNFRDLADLTPNLSQLDNFRPGLSRIQIRGLITPQVGDPPLAFVVDGITASDLEFINQEMFDIERIEVLRGAQGALYGRGAIGGAVNITTKKPTNEFEGKVSASVASGSDVRLSALASGAITEDKTFFRIGASSRSFDGQIDNTFLNEKVDFYDETSVFGMLGFEMSDRTSLALKARVSSTESGLGYYQNVSADTLEDFSIQTQHNVPGKDERDLTEFNAILSHDFAASTLELVAGYSESDQSAFSDADYSAVPSDFIFHFAGAQENILKVESTTFEARLKSSGDTRLRWALGAFLQDRTRDSVFNNYDDTVGDQVMRRGDFTDADIVFSILDDNSSDAWALSTQLNYDITDQLEITGALRHDEDARESFDSRDRTGTFAEEMFSETQPKVSLAYQMSPETLLYAGYSRGFRSGGFNEPSPLTNRNFEEEISDSLELGFKTSFMGGVGTFNAALFSIDQENAQITRFNIDSFTLENISVDDVSSKGFEFELAVQATDQLGLSLNGGKIDSEINAFGARPDLIGFSLPYVAEYNLNAAAEYNFPLSGALDMVMRADIQHTGPRIFSFDVPEIESTKKTFVNLRVGIEAESWSLTAFADNLTDERQVEDLFLFGDGVTDLARYPNAESQFGVEAKYKF